MTDPEQVVLRFERAAYQHAEDHPTEWPSQYAASKLEVRLNEIANAAGQGAVFDVVSGDGVPALLTVTNSGVALYRIIGNDLETWSFGSLERSGGRLSEIRALPTGPGADLGRVEITYSHSVLEPIGGSLKIDARFRGRDETEQILEVLRKLTGFGS
jgi:hypothetical protein